MAVVVDVERRVGVARGERHATTVRYMLTFKFTWPQQVDHMGRPGKQGPLSHGTRLSRYNYSERKALLTIRSPARSHVDS